MYELVRVALSEGKRGSFFEANNLMIKTGDQVMVSTDRGIQIGVALSDVVTYPEDKLTFPLKPILRIATKQDIEKNESNIIEEAKAFDNAVRLSKSLNLKMKFLDADFTIDRSQLLFHYVADDRVDFRELAKKLAQLYRTRIELRQIGIRDKAKEIGGIGPCGRLLCCNLFLTDFASVSISMAKNQLLSLNPNKINGSCGRLLCCLNYEDEVYSGLKRNLPNVGDVIDTTEGKGRVVELLPLKNSYKVELKGSRNVIEVKQ